MFNSIWGSSKKTSGKKANEVKTEIGEQDSTNQKSTGKREPGTSQNLRVPKLMTNPNASTYKIIKDHNVKFKDSR